MAEKPRLTELSGTHKAQCATPAVAGGSDDEVVIFTNDFGRTITVKAISFIPDAAITGHAANNFTLSSQNKALTGAGVTELASLAFVAGVNGVAFQKKVITLSVTAANLKVADGEVLSLKKVEAAAGLALPAGLVSVEFQFAS